MGSHKDCCSTEKQENVSQHHHEHNHEKTAIEVIDPVCGMKVDPKNAKGGSSDYHGQTYYFCSPKCKIKFDNETEK